MIPISVTNNFRANSVSIIYKNINILIEKNLFNISLIQNKNLQTNHLIVYYSYLGNFIYDKYNISFYSPNNYNILYLKKIQKYISYIYIYIWLKITFRGKGFRVRKFYKSNKLTLNFGRSHWTKFLFNTSYIQIKKIRRQNYILFMLFIRNYYKLSSFLRYVKLINWYTKRGLRIKKQRIKKRFGKISQMISSLHF